MTTLLATHETRNQKLLSWELCHGVRFKLLSFVCSLHFLFYLKVLLSLCVLNSFTSFVFSHFCLLCPDCFHMYLLYCIQCFSPPDFRSLSLSPHMMSYSWYVFLKFLKTAFNYIQNIPHRQTVNGRRAHSCFKWLKQLTKILYKKTKTLCYKDTLFVKSSTHHDSVYHTHFIQWG